MNLVDTGSDGETELWCCEIEASKLKKIFFWSVTVDIQCYINFRCYNIVTRHL